MDLPACLQRFHALDHTERHLRNRFSASHHERGPVDCRAASYSLAVYNSLMEQLECHLFLLVKKPYNLDTWRPSVSWLTELKDLCNPGYPHLG